jgi:hypothetical protein
MRFTVAKIPNSQNNAAAVKLPLGVVIQPMALDAKGKRYTYTHTHRHIQMEEGVCV